MQNNSMPFYFDEKRSDLLMSKINLRFIGSRAKQWDHPVKGLLKCSKALKNGLLKASKKERELYCVVLTALALKEDSESEWWVNVPQSDPPDGLVMTIVEEGPSIFKGYLRELEVLEHRKSPELLFDGIKGKMQEKSYTPDTVLVCLLLTQGVYNLQLLAKKLQSISSFIGHVFLIFAGASFKKSIGSKKEEGLNISMVQLLPKFHNITFNLTPHLDDFRLMYEHGRESRLIEGKQIFYGTANPKFHR